MGPQWVASDETSKQPLFWQQVVVPAQCTAPLGVWHSHAPSLHASPALHALLQVPQWNVFELPS